MPPDRQVPPPQEAANQAAPPDCPYCGQMLRVHDGACASCRADLSRACPACFQPNPPLGRFCAHCGSKLAPAQEPHARPPLPQELRPMTVLFCDLVGSTKLASGLGPEDSAAVIAAFHQQVTEQMGRFGGFVARYMGDGALVYFGYPRAHEDDAERAVRAALGAIEAVASVRLPSLAELGFERLATRIGIATGLALVGDMMGVGHARGLDVAGEAPNLAARLQALAEPDTILVSDALRRQIGTLFDCADQGERRVKGWAEPVRTWRVLRAVSHASRFETRLDHRLLPLIGRGPELTRLLDQWRAARAGHGQVALVSGEAGIGKSRLVQELLHLTEAEPQARRRYFCTPHQAAVPLFPFIQQIEHAVGFAEADPPAVRLDKLRTALHGTPADDLALIASLMLPDHAAAQATRLGPQEQRQRTLQALLRLSIATAATQPVLLVLEDAHWSDPTSRELVAAAVRVVPEHAIMLVVTTRPDYLPDWAAPDGDRPPLVEPLVMHPLPAAQSAALVRCVDAAEALDPDVIEDIVQRADGIPLYVEEVTKAVLEAGGSAARPPVPASIHASLLARLDRLGEAREIAEIAAAIGREFSLPLLDRVCGRPASVLRAAMGRLLSSGLVQAAGEGSAEASQFRFKHALIWDAAYGTIVRARRRALHETIAQTLEAHFPQMATAQPQLVAHHYAAADITDGAAKWWLRAGAQAMQRSSTAEALLQLQRALAMVETLPDSQWRRRLELDVLVLLAKATIAASGHAAPATGAILSRARRLCDADHTPAALMATLFGQAMHHLLRSDLAPAQRLTRELLRLGEARGDPTWIATGCYARGLASFPLGAFDRSARLLQRGLGLLTDGSAAVADVPTVGDPRVVTRAILSWALFCRGQVAQAEAASFQAVTEARALGQGYSLAFALNNHCYIATTIHRPQVTLPFVDEMLMVARGHGLGYFVALASIMRGWSIGMAGDLSAGLALLNEGIAAYRATGSRMSMAAVLRLSAELQARAGDLDGALARIEEALALRSLSAERWCEAEARRFQGALLAARGDTAGAEAALHGAITLARAQGAHLWWLRAALTLAQLLVRQGRAEAAAAALAGPCAQFPAEAVFTDLSHARKLLFESSALTMSGNAA